MAVEYKYNTCTNILRLAIIFYQVIVDFFPIVYYQLIDILKLRLFIVLLNIINFGWIK